MRKIPSVPPNERYRPDCSRGFHTDFRIVEYPREMKFIIEERMRWLIFSWWVRIGEQKQINGRFLTIPYKFDTKTDATFHIKNVLLPSKSKPHKVIHTNY